MSDHVKKQPDINEGQGHKLIPPTCSRCDTCGQMKPVESLNDVDDFDASGNHRYLQVCDDCVKAFDSVDISFSFANRAVS